MIDLTLHNFRPDKFYKDFWVSTLGVVLTRPEAERLVTLDRMKERAREAKDKPMVRTLERLREMREGIA